MNISGRLLTLLGLVVLSGCYIDPGPPPYGGYYPDNRAYQGESRDYDKTGREDERREYWEQRRREREYWERQNAQRPPYIPPPPPGPPPPPPPDLRR